MSIELSVVIPVYNESEILSESLKQVREIADSMAIDYEVIIVNDGSTDDTLAIARDSKIYWPELEIISLVSNRGHMAAITAGLHKSAGAWVLTIDADLQDPAFVISEMYELAIKNNVDVVYGIREDRSSDKFLKRYTALIYYKIINRFANTTIIENAADCRLMSRVVVDAVNSLPESNKVYRILIPWLGFPSMEFKYQRNRRTAGNTHYKFKHMVKLAWDSLVNFSSAPLRIATYLGFFGVFVSLIAIVFVVFGAFSGNTITGWPSLMTVVLFLGSLQLLVIGVLGEYISKIYTQIQNRPIYNLTEEQKQ